MGKPIKPYNLNLQTAIYLGTFEEPLFFNLYLGTLTWEPVPAHLRGNLYLEPLLMELYLGT